MNAASFRPIAAGHFLRSTLIGAAALAALPASFAQGTVLHERALSFTFENDLFFGTDRYYTDGVQLTVSRRSDARFEGTKQVLKRACALAECAEDSFLSSQYRFGQLMYTPQNIAVAEPQPLDRPWAGLLYAAADYHFLASERDTLTTITGQVGVIGPGSGVEQTQKWIHKTFTGTPPEGWGNQIGGELGLLASIQRKHALFGTSGTGNAVRVRTDGHWRIATGNIMTYVAAGVTVRIGKGIPLVGDVSPGDIPDKILVQPKHAPNKLFAMGAGPDGAQPSCVFDWLRCTAFAALEGRVMAWNVFLDGPMFRDGPSVKRRPLVADASIGVRLDFPRTRNEFTGPLYLQFKATRRTPEFRSQGPVNTQTFGTLTIGTAF